MPRLTKKIVDGLGPGDRAFCSELPGFFARRQKDGVPRYGVKYTVDGRQRWFTIGTHGKPWTCDEARDYAREVKLRIDKGEDPNALREERREAITVAEFADRYDAEWISFHKKASTAKIDRYNLKNHVRPRLGRIKMKDLSREDVARMHRAMAAHPYSANRCVALVSHMCTIAEKWSEREKNTNPCADIKHYHEKRRERYLSEDELRRLGEALDQAETEAWTSPYVIALIRLLLFTGARVDELRTLRWSETDLHRGLLLLSDSKTGQKAVLLSDEAVQLFRQIDPQPGNPFVFAARTGNKHLVNVRKPWLRIREAAGLDDVRLHDLRHSFASIAAACGASLPIIGGLLGHKQVQTTARYAHLADNPLRKALEDTSRQLSKTFGT